MTSRPVKLVVCTLSLAVMLASSADAAKKMKKPAAPQAIAGTSVPCHKPNLFHCGPIYNAYDYLGNDPDPFIRAMIERDLGAKYGGPE